MNIAQIKTQIAATTGRPLPVLQLVRQFAEDGETPQEWVSHWDNDNRIRVTMHEDILKTLKEDKDFDGLAVKHDSVPAEGERMAYERFVVITPRNIEATF